MLAPDKSGGKLASLSTDNHRDTRSRAVPPSTPSRRLVRQNALRCLMAGIPADHRDDDAGRDRGQGSASRKLRNRSSQQGISHTARGLFRSGRRYTFRASQSSNFNWDLRFSLMLLRALRKSGLWRWLLQDVPLGDDSIELGTVHLGHNPRIDLLLAEVLRRHHRKRREQAAL